MITIPKWEYLGQTFWGNHPSSEELDEFGADGWELVSVVTTLHGGYHCVFKRPKISAIEVRNDE